VVGDLGCGSGNFVYFTDAVSLPHLIQGSTYSAAETASFEGKLPAAGHGNRDEAAMMYSVEFELPVMFGRESASGITRDDRSLSSLPTYQEWDSRSGSMGTQFSIAIASGRTSETISLVSRGKSPDICWTTVRSSRTSYPPGSRITIMRYVGEGMWTHISHCARTVFSVLGLARSPGHGP
jgi:hypothetical protein